MASYAYVYRTVLEGVYVCAHLLEPFMPVTGAGLFARLGTPKTAIKSLSTEFDNLKPGTCDNSVPPHPLIHTFFVLFCFVLFCFVLFYFSRGGISLGGDAPHQCPLESAASYLCCPMYADVRNTETRHIPF